MNTVAKIGFVAAAGSAIFASSAGECTDETCANEEATLLQIQKAKSGSRTRASKFGHEWMYATDFIPYFDYPGNLKVAGSVLYTPSANPSDDLSTDGVVLTWALEGLDPECDKGADPDINGNSCGVHIHAGTNCEEDAGSHYWNSDSRYSDPWGCIRYTSLKLFHWVKSIMSNVMVLDGWTFDDIEGRTAIIHNFQGARIACAIIKRPWWHGSEDTALQHADSGSMEACVQKGLGDEKHVNPEKLAAQMSACAAEATPEELKSDAAKATSFGPKTKYCAKDFVQYWEYDVIDPVIPDGVVHVADAGVVGASLNPALNGQRLSWNLHDLDPECDQGPADDVPNSCGIHIHEATTCEDEVPAGPHYWNTELLHSDPWLCTSFTSYDDNGKWTSKVRSCEAVPVLDGLTLDQVVGHAVLIHNSAGTKVACAVIQEC